MGYEQRTFPDTQSCRIYFCCFPLALENIRPWPLVPFSQISLKNSELKITHSTFGIVVCTFSDNLSWNSYNVQSCTCSSIIWVCGQNPTVWPFKCIPSGSNFTWCYLFFSILHVEILLNNDFWPWVIIQAFTILWCTPRFSMRAGGQQNWLTISRKPAYYFSLEISPV